MAKAMAAATVALFFALPATPAASRQLSEAAAQQAAKALLQDSGQALQWGDINILQVTDVHSYISGHRHNDSTVNTGYGPEWGDIATAPQDADYADLLATIEHLKHQAAAAGKSLFVFNSGDVVDGTGISNLSPTNGEFLTPLLREIPFDALTIGNHELYQDSTVEHLVQSHFIHDWNGSYLTSNVLSAAPSAVDTTHHKAMGEPLGERYRIVQADNDSETSVMVFGFLYHFTDSCASVTVTALGAAVNETWFGAAMDRIPAEGVDAVVVLAHMDWDLTDITLFSNAVRSRYPNMPIAFLAGHTHYRRFHQRDSRAISMESGNYFNTIGWLSFNKSTLDATTPIDFWWRMIDANKATLRELTGRPTEALFATTASTQLRADILQVRQHMGLDAALGCNPGVALVVSGATPLTASNSAWGTLMRDVMPAVLFQPPHNPLMWEVESTGGLRKDMYHGSLTVRLPCVYPVLLRPR